MAGLSELQPSYLALGLGGVLVLLGLGLVVLSAVRKLNDLGEMLRGLFLGAGLTLLAGGAMFHFEAPTATLRGLFGSTSLLPLRAPAAETANIGEYVAQEVYRYGASIRGRLTYFVPTTTICLLVILGLASARWFRGLFGAGAQQGVQGFVTAMLIPLAFLAIGNYTSFTNFRHGTYFNAYEFYHYYIGTKYAPEVGYENMYNASLIAEDELGGRAKGAKNTLRDLSNGKHVNVDTVYPKREQIKAQFTEARWQEFLKDIHYFKRELGAGRWSGILSDKGYNGTPFWSMWVGGLLSNRVDTSNETGMMMLALIDPLLITIAALCVWRAFGLRASLLMLILLGTSYVMSYSHMKGAYLRTDFAMSLVIAVCMLKRNHYRTAGALMMYAAISRVFPAVFFFGAGVKFLQSILMYFRPRMKDIGRAIVNGVVLTLVFALIAPALLLLFKGGQPWREALFAFLPFVPTPDKIDPLLMLGVNFAAAALFGFAFAVAGLLARTPQCRPHVRLFVTAGLVLVAFSVAVLADPRTGKRCVEDFAGKIGRHLADLSPWRVGYKYLFINQPALQTERLRADAAAAPAEAATPEAPAESPDDHADAPDVVEAPAPAKGATPAPPADETGLGRMWISTLRDMRFAAEKAWAKELGKDGAVVPPLMASTVINAAFASGDHGKAFRSFVFEFFKTYVPNIRGKLYTDHADEWRMTMLIVLLLSFVAVLGLKDHEALAWSFVPAFFLVAPTYYYYIMLLIPLLFFTSALERPSRVIGAIFLLATAMPGYYFYSQLGYGQQFATYYWHSVILLFLCAYMLLIAYGDTLAAGLRRVLGKGEAA